MENIISNSLSRAVTYKEYRETIAQLLSQGKTSGHEQSEALVHYTLLNETRMNRLEKTIKIGEDIRTVLRSLTHRYTWLVLSEGWCGDAAQIVPIVDKMAEASRGIALKIAFRDDNPELMDLFLTNGSKAIPKLIVLDKDNRVVANWGPRPLGASELIARHKAEKGHIDDQAKTELQMWYLHDKGIAVQAEIAAMMQRVELERS